MSTKIRVAIAGIGSCASALVQGVEFYLRNPENTIGLMYPEIGGYKTQDIEFVLGFDIDTRKVDTFLQEALYALPNCNMRVIDPASKFQCIETNARTFRGPTLDGIAPHMRRYHSDITFQEDTKAHEISAEEYKELLKKHQVDILLNYMPVGAEEASKWYINNAIEAGVHVINCMPTFISTEDAKQLEVKAIEHKVTIVGSDMRSSYGASRLSEVLQGSMMDAGLVVTQHIQMNMAAGTTQGQEHIINGRSANTDFLNMAEKARLHNKHVSKENVLSGQSIVRGKGLEGMTMFAGPSLTVVQRPGGEYMGTDNKVCNIDLVAYGFAGARYELTARLSVQDSPNSGGIVVDAIRFCRVAREMDIVGYLRGPSAWSQKTPPVQMTTADAKFECDAMARRVYTPITEKQKISNLYTPDNKVSADKISELDYTFQKGKTEYE
ncbi:MAG: inositol-3-phosphate synthase [Sediminibacterium sp.]